MLKLEKITKELRKEIIRISYIKKAHHIGSELSCIDILVILYFSIMNIKPSIKNKQFRDFFLLSKGHAALALYVVLCKKGFFSKEFLDQEFLVDGGILGGHPDYNPSLGIEFSSGSLGHGLSVGAGIALAKKRDNVPGNVYVLLGDGECNEGTFWESMLLGANHDLDNLCWIIDYNRSNDRALKLDSLEEKLNAFGWSVDVIDGHEHNEIICSTNNICPGKPKAIIANTIKGCGVKEMENNPAWHHRSPSKEELKEMIKELS